MNKHEHSMHSITELKEEGAGWYMRAGDNVRVGVKECLHSETHRHRHEYTLTDLDQNEYHTRCYLTHALALIG